MTVRLFVAWVLLLAGGCTQTWDCPYFCGESTVPVGLDTEYGGDLDEVRGQCEKDSSKCADAGPVRCNCIPDDDFSPGTESPSPQPR